jgi:hypothetical protein
MDAKKTRTTFEYNRETGELKMEVKPARVFKEKQRFFDTETKTIVTK